ncbi:beta-galactosidase-1-like protein [Oppia nitens]|uniref:beta-galactosidase-1-like protein n=1 Tax=Oppia nitens TaxID=1686743 RepID=UPI0023DAA907|nr:beta-galactosidase-1-like protein [Oppia nitens]
MFLSIIKLLLFSLLIILFVSLSYETRFTVNKSFIIDKTNNQFLKDGQPFRYIAGHIEYFKVPAVLWRDRLTKYKMAGLNAIQIYVEWNSHEPEEGMYHFDGDNDLIGFLKLANELDLLVLVRTGPFIDAERDMGGLPYWLLSKNPNMKLRTSDPSYLVEVDKWYDRLLPMLIPMLYKNGGPVIMVQIENEYGSYFACDFNYLKHLRDLHYKYLGSDVLFYTTDGGEDYYLKCGKIDNVFATVDFGSERDVNESFAAQRSHQPYGPYVNSEYYTGWIDHWEETHSTVTSAAICKGLDQMLALNASVTLYPMHGGTSFGFTAGSNIHKNRFYPLITSYDFDAPLTESGDPTAKYYDVRNVIGKYLTLPVGTLPKPEPKMQTKPLLMKSTANIYDAIETLVPIESVYPKTFESLRLRQGFILYSTTVTNHTSDPAVLTVNGLRDRAQVFVDKKYAGTLSRTQSLYTLGLDIEFGSQLDIFVENQGRPDYGIEIHESKGITENVTLGSVVLKNWKHYLLFTDWQQYITNFITTLSTSLLSETNYTSVDRIPTFFTTEFVLPNDSTLPLDSFLRLDGWRKGLAFLNGFNLGRYWTVGPQLTLYAPRHLFNAYPMTNTLIVFELERSAPNMTVQFVATSVLNATIPFTSEHQLLL